MAQLSADLKIQIDHLSTILSTNLGFEEALIIIATPAYEPGKANLTIYYPGDYDPYPQAGYVDHVVKSIGKSRITEATTEVLKREQLPTACKEDIFDAGKEIRKVGFTANPQQIRTLASKIESASKLTGRY